MALYVAAHILLGAVYAALAIAAIVTVMAGCMWIVERVRWRVSDNIAIVWHYACRTILYTGIGVFVLMLLYVFGGGRPL